MMSGRQFCDFIVSAYEEVDHWRPNVYDSFWQGYDNIQTKLMATKCRGFFMNKNDWTLTVWVLIYKHVASKNMKHATQLQK